MVSLSSSPSSDRQVLVLIAEPHPFVDMLERFLQAADVVVVRSSEDAGELHQALKEHLEPGRRPRCVWISDLEPSHQRDHTRTKSILRVLYEDKVSLLAVFFDALIDPQKSKGRVYQEQGILSVFPDASLVSYSHVVSLFPTPLSWVDTWVHRKGKGITAAQADIVVAPLWVEDCCAHLARLALQSSEGISCFAGLRAVPLKDVVAPFAPTPVENSESVIPQFQVTQGIPGRGVEAIQQLIAPTTTPIRQDLPVESPSRFKQHLVPIGLSLTLLAGIVCGGSIVMVRGLRGSFHTVIQTGLRHENTSQLLAFDATLHRLEASHLPVATLLGLNVAQYDILRESLQLQSKQSQIETTAVQAYAHLFALPEGKGSDVEQALSILQNQLASSQTIAAHIKTLWDENPGVMDSVLGTTDQETLKGQLSAIQKQLSVNLSYATLLTTLSQHEKGTIALVLQDDSVPMGSGGVPSAVALFHLERGQVFQTDVVSVQSLMDRFVGTAQSPDVVRKFTGNSVWTLRESAMAADASSAASSMAWFLEKSIGTPVNAVFTLNADDAANLIATAMPTSQWAHGGVEAKLRDVVSRQTLLAVDQDGLFTAVLQDLIKVMTDHSQAGQVMTTFKTLLEQRQATLFIAPTDPAAKLAHDLALDGSMMVPSCPTSLQGECQAQSMLVSQSAVGASHAAWYVRQSQQHTIHVGEQSLIHERLLTLTNESPTFTWPYGTYQTIVTLRVPASAAIQEVSVNGISVQPSQLLFSSDATSHTVRLAVSVPVHQTVVVRVVSTSAGISAKGSALVFLEEAQPGLSGPFDLIIDYPDTYTPSVVSTQAEVERNRLRFHSTHHAPQVFVVRF